MSNKRGGPAEPPSFLQEVAFLAVSALFSCLVLSFGLKRLDPNRQTSKAAEQRKKEIAKRLGRPKLVTNVYEDAIAADVANPDHINVTFNSIGGLEDTKEALQELVILPLVRPELFSKSNLLKPAKGVLLYGPASESVGERVAGVLHQRANEHVAIEVVRRRAETRHRGLYFSVEVTTVDHLHRRD